MTNSFEITTASSTVQLNGQRRGEVVFTVTNSTAETVAGRANVTVDNPIAESWVSVEGDTKREFGPSATEQIVVQIAAPDSAPIGSYSLLLEMIGVENPDEDFTQGPTVRFELTAVPEPEPPKTFPWWIVAAVVGGLLLLGLGFFVGRALRGPDDFSLFDAAPEARWFALDQAIPFAGAPNSASGFVGHTDGVVLEDGNTYTALATSPPEKSRVPTGSFLHGEFVVPKIVEGQHFRTQIGRMQILQRPRFIPIRVSVTINRKTVFDLQKQMSGNLADIDVDLSPYAGEDIPVLIQVFRPGFDDLGLGENTIYWIDPRITSGD